MVILIQTVDFGKIQKRRSFPFGFLCAFMELAYLEKSSTVMNPYLSTRGKSTTRTSLGGLAVADFGCIQLYCLSKSVSPWIPCWSQNPFCIWGKCHDCRPGYLQLFVSLFLSEVCQSNQIVQGTWFRILCSLVDWVFLSLWVQFVLWGFWWVLGCDPRVFRLFQVSGTRKCCFAALVCSFWEVCVGKQSGQVHLAESYWGLLYLLVWCTWNAPDRLRRIQQSLYSFWLDMVISLYWLLWLLFFYHLLSTLSGRSANFLFL